MTKPSGAPAFGQIVADHGALISRIAMSYEADPAVREDLVQQIFLALWQALPGFRGESSLKTFIARIAQNRAVSHVARRVREPASSEISEDIALDAPSPEDRADESSKRRVLLNATRSLPLPQREVMILLLEGFSYVEIAGMLNVPQNAVALRCARAKAALKSILEQK